MGTRYNYFQFVQQWLLTLKTKLSNCNSKLNFTIQALVFLMNLVFIIISMIMIMVCVLHIKMFIKELNYWPNLNRQKFWNS